MPTEDKLNDLVVTVDNLLVRVVTHYTDREWWPDEYNEEYGHYVLTQKAYDKPKIEIIFWARVNTRLSVGSIYTDGTNKFIATGEFQIRSYDNDIDVFQIPRSLICIYTPYAEGSIVLPEPIRNSNIK
jgi:hypothetical protein